MSYVLVSEDPLRYVNENGSTIEPALFICTSNHVIRYLIDPMENRIILLQHSAEVFDCQECLASKILG